MSAVLEARRLGKAFRSYRSELQRFATWLGWPVRAESEYWALRDLDITIDAGESVAFVGQNGAGKSTFLKLIAGTLKPTEGTFALRGRVAAILELGLGFNPEFTGRQNATHAAGLMGHSAQHIAAAMDGIEAFAEIGEYFDQPVRTYSSGMQVRVAFAVVTAFRPDVLIVDEALSVGDAYFQHKSFERIRQFQREGTSLLIVSHDRAAIQALCSRAILLEAGRVIRDGDPSDVMDYYNALIAEREADTVRERRHESGRSQVISGTREAEVEDIALHDADGQPREHFNVGEPVELRIDIVVKTALPRLVLGYMIKDRLGQPVYGTNTHHTRQELTEVAPGKLRFNIRFPLSLGPGSYSVSTALVSTDTHLVNNYEWRELALVFSVGNEDKPPFVGTAWIPPQIEIAAR